MMEVRDPIPVYTERLINSNEKEFEKLNDFLIQSLQENLINQEQYSHLIGLFLDNEDLKSSLIDFNLFDKYNQYQLTIADIEYQIKQEEERKQREFEEEQQLIKLEEERKQREFEEKLIKLTQSLQLIEENLRELNSQLIPIEQQYNQIKARIEAYQAYDNPKLKSEENKLKIQLDELNSKISAEKEKYQSIRNNKGQ